MKGVKKMDPNKVPSPFIVDVSCLRYVRSQTKLNCNKKPFSGLHDGIVQCVRLTARGQEDANQFSVKFSSKQCRIKYLVKLYEI